MLQESVDVAFNGSASALAKVSRAITAAALLLMDVTNQIDASLESGAMKTVASSVEDDEDAEKKTATSLVE